MSTARERNTRKVQTMKPSPALEWSLTNFKTVTRFDFRVVYSTDYDGDYRAFRAMLVIEKLGMMKRAGIIIIIKYFFSFFPPVALESRKSLLQTINRPARDGHNCGQWRCNPRNEIEKQRKHDNFTIN